MVRNYKNFDDLFYSLNRELLLSPECFDYVNSGIGFADNLLLKCESFDCTLNIGDFGYKINKWTAYSKKMVDKEKLKLFKDELVKSNGNCSMFEFCTENMPKGGSMLCMVFKRHDYRSKWKTVDVYFRVAELQRDLALDLVLLNVLLRDMPNIKLSNINLYISQANISATYINGYLDYFDLGIEELDSTHPFVKSMISAKKRYFSDKDNLSNYNAVLVMQKMYFGMYKIPNIRVLDLELGE